MARVGFLPRAERLVAMVLGASVILCILLGLAGEVRAQSGRRTKRSEPTRPAPTKEAEPPAEEQPPPEPARPEPVEPKYHLIVSADTSNVSNNRNITSYILGNCVQHLKETPLLSVTVGNDINRRKASERAKAEKEAYVVWLEFEGDNFSGSSRISDYYVTYIIYTPGTGKVKNQGRVNLRQQYQNVPTVGVGGIAVPLPVPLPPGTTLPGQNPSGARYPLEQSLQQAGRETGDRIMSVFDIATVPGRRFPLLGSGN